LARTPSVTAAPAAGSALVFLGELRWDLGFLDRFVRRSGARLVSTLYDVLPLDWDGTISRDPRRLAMLPAFDFMAARSDLVLSISQYSADRLKDYAKHRGLSLAPLHVLPLGDDIPHSPRLPHRHARTWPTVPLF
jgi:hypothetical protein